MIRPIDKEYVQPTQTSMDYEVEIFIPDFGGMPTLPTPTEAPNTTAASISRVQALGGSLTETEMRNILIEAEWPEELIPGALSVSYCESKWSPYAAGDSGASVGLFQLNKQTWFHYFGYNPEDWANPIINARVALQTYYYDITRGQPPWKQWSCKP